MMYRLGFASGIDEPFGSVNRVIFLKDVVNYSDRDNSTALQERGFVAQRPNQFL